MVVWFRDATRKYLGTQKLLGRLESIYERLDILDAADREAARKLDDALVQFKSNVSPKYTEVARSEITGLIQAPYVFASTACRSDYFKLPLFRYWCSQLKHEPRLHRKAWEWVYIAHALYERGCLAPGKRGVGFGVGAEPLADLFCSRGCSLLTTDLDESGATRTGWGLMSLGCQYHGISDEQHFKSRVEYRPVDMNHIPNDIRNYDFCYSSCSIEHVGTLDLSKHFLRSVLDVLRPGGISIHTTEFNYTASDETVESGPTILWRRRDFEEIAAQLRKEGHEVAPLDFDIGSHELDKHVDFPPYSDDLHTRLRIESFGSTSFGFIVQKRLS